MMRFLEPLIRRDPVQQKSGDEGTWTMRPFKAHLARDFCILRVALTSCPSRLLFRNLN